MLNTTLLLNFESVLGNMLRGKYWCTLQEVSGEISVGKVTYFGWMLPCGPELISVYIVMLCCCAQCIC